MPAAALERGHALLVMMIVLVMGSLYGIVGELDGLRLKLAQAGSGDASLAMAKEALLAYAATYRDNADHKTEVFGYLPCPDTAEKTGLTAPGDGSAASHCGHVDEAVVGLLPYRTLGLPELRDSAGHCLWYAVSGRFKNAPKPTTALNWDTQSELGVLDAQGAALAMPEDAHGGAAAIVFSPGPALPGQERTPIAQPCAADPARATAYLESAANHFVSGDTADAAGNATNNDRLVWLTPREIFGRIAARADFRNPLGSLPEGQINRLIDAQRKALDGRLWANLSALTAASSGSPNGGALPDNDLDYRQFAGKRVGDVPNLEPLAYGGRNFDSDFRNWQEQFRYVVCSDLRPVQGCLTAGARNCRGALLFGGRAVGGGPRPSAQKPHAPPPSRSDWLPHYFETGGVLPLLDGPTLSFAAGEHYDAGSPGADVGVCLSPGGFSSFARDIGTYSTMVTSAPRPEATINSTAKTVVLGNTAGTAAGRGCAWFPTQLPFSASLRAYFKLRLADAGEGFVFAVADGPANASAMAAGTLCGTATGSHLGYSASQVAAPKFGLEIDTRSQSTGSCSGGNRNDPAAQHAAFVYWGAAGTHDDDNCHGAGSRPQNPRTLGAGIRTVQASDPHLPYSGSFPLDTDIHVRLEATKSFDGTPVAAASWMPTAAAATVVTAAPHGLRSGQRVRMTGIDPAAYNGEFEISVAGPAQFSYALGNDPGVYISGGHLSAPGGRPVAGASWVDGKLTLTTDGAHGFVDGQPLFLSGTAPTAYDGAYTATVVGPSQLSFARPNDPGPYVSGGVLSPAVTLTLKAYIASKLLVFSGSYVSTCTSADLRNLSVGLDDLCTQNPTLRQDEVRIDADPATGRALASVYVGFANAQSTGAAGLQRLTISDFFLKTE